MWEPRVQTPGAQGVTVCVQLDATFFFSLQWPRVSRPGLPKMEADFISCLSPALPSSSLAYNPILFSPAIQFHSFSTRVHTHYTSKRQTFTVFLGQAHPRYAFWDLALGGWGGWALARESRPGRGRTLVAGGFLAKFLFSLGDLEGSHPKKAKPQEVQGCLKTLAFPKARTRAWRLGQGAL